MGPKKRGRGKANPDWPCEEKNKFGEISVRGVLAMQPHTMKGTEDGGGILAWRRNCRRGEERGGVLEKSKQVRKIEGKKAGQGGGETGENGRDEMFPGTLANFI